jgi:hypothetical protein
VVEDAIETDQIIQDIQGEERAAADPDGQSAETE